MKLLVSVLIIDPKTTVVWFLASDESLIGDSQLSVNFGLGVEARRIVIVPNSPRIIAITFSKARTVEAYIYVATKTVSNIFVQPPVLTPLEFLD
jgi:hypothetical protein